MITRVLAGMAMVAVAGCGHATAAAPTVHATFHYRVRVVSHRTDAGNAPENTIKGIWAGAKTGAELVEFDVQQTRDHRLVLMHDKHLTRTTNAEQVYPGRSPWLFQDFTFKQLRRLDAGDGQKIPTLDEALDAAWHAGVGVLLECKNPNAGYADLLVKTLRRHPYWNTDPHRLLLTSLDLGFLQRLHKRIPHYKLDAIFIHPVTGKTIRSVSRYAWGIGIKASDTNPKVMDQVRAAGLHLIVGQTNTPTDMQRILRLHPYAISSNTPEQVLGLEGR